MVANISVQLEQNDDFKNIDSDKGKRLSEFTTKVKFKSVFYKLKSLGTGQPIVFSSIRNEGIIIYFIFFNKI